MFEEKIVIIFSGYNDRAVVSFIRTLETNKLNYVVIARDSEDLIFKTAYSNKVFLTRESKYLSLGVISRYIAQVRKELGVGQCFVAPSTEALNRFLLSERKALERINVAVPLPDAGVYESVSDKKAFGELCRESGILVPNEYASFAEAKIPFVSKPRRYTARNGEIHTPLLIFSEEQKESFLIEYDLEDFYFQEYVEGRSIYLLYYFSRKGQIFKFSQENILQQPGGNSIIAAIPSDFHNSAVSMKYEDLFRKLGFYGLVMVELRVNQSGKYMIEANPRFWGPSQLFVDSGMNFFEALLYEYGIKNNEPIFIESKESRYFWFGGIQNIIKEQGGLSYLKGNEKDFMMDLDKWVCHDIFKREDTIDVFNEGIK